MRYTVYLLAFCWASSAGAAIVWDYDSPLTVMENVTDIGGGEYRYEYSFVNEDTQPITSFGTFAAFEIRAESTFAGLLGTWKQPLSRDVNTVASRVDGRNLDPAIVCVIYTDSCVDGVPQSVCPGELGIQPGQAVKGFSFTASVYSTSPKYYFYSTPDSGYPGYTNRFAAVGTTIPEPATLMLLGFGSLALLRKHRA